MVLHLPPIQIPLTTRFDQSKPENQGDEPHQQIEKLLTPHTHRDGLPEQDLSLGKISDKLEKILYQPTHDWKKDPSTLMQEEKKGHLTLVTLDKTTFYLMQVVAL